MLGTRVFDVDEARVKALAEGKADPAPAAAAPGGPDPRGMCICRISC